MPFGDFIRQKREEAEIPLNDFARRIGISPAYWSRIERNMEKPPKDDLITKAAQQLYLHRNSLQYKIDKWEELTGLQLKNLTDLALCYHLVLQDVI